jgi:hypothetical protein
MLSSSSNAQSKPEPRSSRQYCIQKLSPPAKERSDITSPNSNGCIRPVLSSKVSKQLLGTKQSSTPNKLIISKDSMFRNVDSHLRLCETKTSIANIGKGHLTKLTETLASSIHEKIPNIKRSPFEPKSINKEEFHSFDNFIHHKTFVYDDEEVRMMFEARDCLKDTNEHVYAPNSFMPSRTLDSNQDNSWSRSHGIENPKKFQKSTQDAVVDQFDSKLSDGSDIIMTGVEKLEIDYEFLNRMAPSDMRSQIKHNGSSKRFTATQEIKKNEKLSNICITNLGILNNPRQHLMRDTYDELNGISFTKVESHMTYKTSKLKPFIPNNKTPISSKFKNPQNKSVTPVSKRQSSYLNVDPIIADMNLSIKIVKPNLVDSLLIENLPKKAPETESQPQMARKPQQRIENLKEIVEPSVIHNYFELIYSKKAEPSVSDVRFDRPRSQVAHRNRVASDVFVKFREQKLSRF